MTSFRNILWGVIFIVIGLIIGGNALDLFDINIFFDGWWTLFIIIPCFMGLFNAKEVKSNLIGLFIGIVLLLCSQDILDFDLMWKLMLPCILIIIGLSFIFKDTFNKKLNDNIKKLNKNIGEDNSCCATFAGENIKYGKKKFNGASLNAIFGGIKYDLRDAIIDKDVVINASSIFGGIDIIVPDGVSVKVKSTSIFGGVNNKTDDNDSDVIIYVNATCLFGGVDIK